MLFFDIPSPFLKRICKAKTISKIGIPVGEHRVPDLAEETELANDIDYDRAKKSLQHAVERSKGEILLHSLDSCRSELSRKRAFIRIHVAESIKMNKNILLHNC